MISRIRTLTVAGLACFGMLTRARESCAATAWHWCNDVPVKWDSQLRMHRDGCSMPTNSDADWAYWNGGWQWWQIAQKMDWSWVYNAGCAIALGNGLNQTALVPRAQIGGANGLTICTMTGCPRGSSRSEYTECDVQLADDMQYAPEDESFWNWENSRQGRAVILHEFGHVLGLDHSTELGVMQATSAYPLAGGNTAEPWPDDAYGVRYLYGGSGTNVFVSAQMLSDGAVVATGPSDTLYVCSGQQVTVNVTVANNGTTSLSNIGFRVFLHNGPNNYSGGFSIWSGTASLDAYQQATVPLTMTIPTYAADGLYYLLWQIDTNGTAYEWNEDDNAVHSATTLQIITC